MDLKDRIVSLVPDLLENQEHFLVDVVVGSGPRTGKILVLIDGDQGITIEDCARVSRKLGGIIEEENLIEDKFLLEVSSPGLDHPLQHHRQMVKNQGRDVKIFLKEGEEITGNLAKVTGDSLTILKKGKKKEPSTERGIPIKDIDRIFVTVKFK